LNLKYPPLERKADMTADMKAARMREYGEALILENIPIPDIQPDEILVNVKACGMCRSDVQLIDGYFRKYADIPTPITLGHEITGVVSKVGSIVPKASGFKEGDHVVVAPGWGDGTCRHCQIGNTHICPNVRWPGFGPVGGFAEFIPAPARYVIKVDSRLKFEELAPLTDAGLTPYRGIKKLRDVDQRPLCRRGPGRRSHRYTTIPARVPRTHLSWLVLGQQHGPE
jgi:alcohol dehydrogenase, propanol-preferring